MNLNMKRDIEAFTCYQGRRVLVTGHTGFKGSWLCEWLLALGAEVHGFALEPPTRPSLFNQLKLAKRIASHTIGDVRDLDLLVRTMRRVKPDFVFHLAAQPLVRLSYEKPAETFDTNVMGTVNVLEAARVLTSPDLMASSCSNLPQGQMAQRLGNAGNKKASSDLMADSCSKLPQGQMAQRQNNAGNKATSSDLMAELCSATPQISIVCITTDKVYENNEKGRPFRETDPFGGHDPYSASKGACEIVISSYRRSFFGTPNSPVWVASARAGNVIGGGDWAKDRIVPDAMRALAKGATIPVRNIASTRPWQHVLEPLGGYLALGAALAKRERFDEVCGGFNFGPDPKANRTVKELVEEMLKWRKGTWVDKSDPNAVHEAGLLNLDIRKARRVLGWKPRWGFEETVKNTVQWYAAVANGANPVEATNAQIMGYDCNLNVHVEHEEHVGHVGEVWR